jgi:hypothetical protein
MDVSASLDAPFPASAVFPWVAELERYPSWLDIVRSAVPDGAGAWSVDLRARLGPFSRSKRLRMTRAELVPDRHARFVRNEVDGREHSPWVLEAVLEPDGDAACTVTMSLHYGGSDLPSAVERLLGGEIERCKRRLIEVVSTASAPER